MSNDYCKECDIILQPRSENCPECGGEVIAAEAEHDLKMQRDYMANAIDTQVPSIYPGY